MKNFIKEHKWNARNIIGAIVALSFIASIVFVIIRLCIAPVEASPDMPYEKIRSDYVLMLMQCVLGLFLILLSYLLERKWRILFPDMMYILVFIFLYCAIYLGEVRSFYYNVPHWDTILHAISAAMLATLGFSIVNLLNSSTIVKVELSPFFVSFFAFCFAVAFGAIWEIYEYTFDYILGFNMQKYATVDGVDLVGRAALYDTMKDIIVDTISAFVMSAIGYMQLRFVIFQGKRLKINSFEPIILPDLAATSEEDVMDFIYEENRIYAENEKKEVIAEITFPYVHKSIVEINHTFVDESLRGQGAAGKLMTAAVDYISSRNLKIKPTCSYAVNWFEKHPEKHEIVTK